MWAAAGLLDAQAPAFVARQHDLTTHLGAMQDRCARYQQERHLHEAKRPILERLHHHWSGLTVFLTRPEVALDHNSAARALRTPVVGRKNYYGSGSIWSAHLAAMMLSVLPTLLVWGLNPRHWLSAFFHACVAHGSQPPPDLSAFLPWQMTDERKHQLAQPLPVPQAATPKFEAKRQGASHHSNGCIAVSLGGYSASNFMGSAICFVLYDLLKISYCFNEFVTGVG